MEHELSAVPRVVQQIKQILVEDLKLKLVPDQIPDDYSLLEGGLALDSVVIAELIVHIEDRFGFQFDDRELRAELFDDLSALATLVAGEALAARAHPERARAGVPSC